jgi:hypothetical protein
MLGRAFEAVPAEAVFVGERKLIAQLERSRDRLRPTEVLRLATARIRIGETERGIALIEELLARDDLKPDVRDTARLAHAAANLRLAEQQNCLEHHDPTSCVYPLVPAARHHEAPEGATEAYAAYRSLLEDEDARDDGDRPARGLTLRWLLEIARSALGTDAEELPEGWRIEVPIDPEVADLAPLEDIGARAGGVDIPELSGGCVLDDFDGDGIIDLLASSIYPFERPGTEIHYFHGNGDGTFEDRTEAAGLSRVRGGLNLIQGDYDNDGDLDVFVLRGGWKQAAGQWPNTLLRNDGGRFVDVTVEAGLLAFQPTQVGSWCDFDQDGLLDLFVGNETGVPVLMGDAISQTFAESIFVVQHALSSRIPAHLYRNNGDGTFTDVIGASGIELFGWVKGATWGDYDNDGLADLFVSIWGRPNRLFRNLGSGRFVDVADEAGVREHLLSFATWFFDYDADGNLDLFIASFPYPEIEYARGRTPMQFAWSPEPELTDLVGGRGDGPWNPRPVLYRNRGDGTFEDVTQAAEIDKIVSAMGANFDDVDGDGLLDLLFGTGAPNLDYLVPNRLFLARRRDDGSIRYVDASIPLRFSHLQKGHAIAVADIDADGDQDVYTVLGGAFPTDVFPNALLENPGYGNSWVHLDLEGSAGGNRSAIGARVRLELRRADGSRFAIERQRSSGGSFGSSSLRLEIGCGDATAIESLTILWPDAARTTQAFDGARVRLGSRYRIRQGGMPENVTPVDRPGPNPVLGASTR